MKASQLNSLIAAFSGAARQIRMLNGFSAGNFEGLDDETRVVGLQLVAMFARWADHSRAGTLEMQVPEDAVKGLDLAELKTLFEGVGFATYDDGLEPKMALAAHCLKGELRVPHRTLSAREEANMKEMVRQVEEIKKLQAFSEPQ